MCGILGVLRPSERHRAAAGQALDTIAHRGPDGDGHFSDADVLLGHRRLAVIDPHPRGRQPMVDDASGAVITYNGEIYNYLEIREELIAAGDRFITQTDTEVLLRAYLRWGPQAFARLNGMWALAIWEPRHQRLFVTRDRFGVKPLYIADAAGSFLFASEPKALFAFEPALAEPDPAALAELFSGSRMHSGRASFFPGIEALEPGSWMTVDSTSERRGGRYWDYPAPGELRGHGGDFNALFDDAVKLRLRSDVPVGLTLSGGLDSSAVLSGAHRAGAAMRCFTSVYPGSGGDEAAWAERAAALGEGHLEKVRADGGDWLATLEKIVWHMDSPGYSPAVFPLWRIMERARAENVPVLLEGQGADELLAGYPQYVPMANGDLLRQRGFGGLGAVAGNAAGSLKTFGWRPSAQWTARALLPGLGDRWRRRRGGGALLGGHYRPAATGPSLTASGRSLLHQRLLDDFSRDILPALLHYGDAVSMAHGIESRLPFLDYRIVEWVFGAQPALIENGRTKTPVRDYLAATGFGAIAVRPDKLGYPTPVGAWLRGIAQPILRDLVATPGAPIWSYFDAAAAGKMLDRAAGGDNGAVFHLYKLLTTEIWLRQLTDARLRTPPLPAAATPAPPAAAMSSLSSPASR